MKQLMRIIVMIPGKGTKVPCLLKSRLMTKIGKLIKRLTFVKDACKNEDFSRKREK